MATGTIVDATIISAPSSTKNKTKKGNQWYFGMKAHFGVVLSATLAGVATAAWISLVRLSPSLHSCPSPLFRRSVPMRIMPHYRFCSAKCGRLARD